MIALASSCSRAQGVFPFALTGIVIDESSGEPVPNVRVAIPSLQALTYTDGAGFYQILAIGPPGCHSAQASFLGYDMATYNIDVSDPTLVSLPPILLRPSPWGEDPTPPQGSCIPSDTLSIWPWAVGHARVYGEVHDSTGSSMPSHPLVLTQCGYWQYTITDSLGRYSISAVLTPMDHDAQRGRLSKTCFVKSRAVPDSVKVYVMFYRDSSAVQPRMANLVVRNRRSE